MSRMLPVEIEKKVTELFSRDGLPKLALDWIADRRKPLDTVDLYRMKLSLAQEGLSFTDAAILEFFTQLQDAGIGEVTVKALPDHSSFRTRYPMKFILHVAKKVG